MNLRADPVRVSLQSHPGIMQMTRQGFSVLKSLVHLGVEIIQPPPSLLKGSRLCVGSCKLIIQVNAGKR